MPYTAKERLRVNLKARRILGKSKRRDAQDRRIFMEQCIGELMDSGEAEDEGDARDVCEMLWQEESDLFD